MAKKRNTKSKSKRQPKQPKQPKTKIVYRDKPQMSVGAMIGDGLQKWGTSIFKRITGMGDYKMGEQMAHIKKNSLFQDAKNQPPSFSNGMSSFIFEHSEYIGDIVSSSIAGGYSVQSFNVSPSDPACFPWLCSIAENFQQYEVEGMIFRFESTSGSSVASTNTAIGSVMGLFSYDYADPLPTSKQSFLQYDGCVDARANESFLVGVECAPDSLPYNKLYLGTPTVGQDPRMNYKGKFVIASNGLPGTSVVIGELWCHYKVRLSIASLPNINSIGGEINGSIRFTNTGATNSLPYGSLLPFSGSIKTTSVTLTVINANAIRLTGMQVGAKYLIQYVYTGAVGNTPVLSPGMAYTGVSFTDPGAITVAASGADAVYTAVITAASAVVDIASSPTGMPNGTALEFLMNQFDTTVY